MYNSSWCTYLDCTKDLLTTLNVEGSAIFWVNLDSQGEGRVDMLHAGLPAGGGEKVGLNVWTDISLKEVQGRGMFGGWSRHWKSPSKEFLVEYGLVAPEGEGVR
jgi:prolyl 4-hydroxylase